MLPCPLGVCHPGQIGLEMNLTSVSFCSLLLAVLGFPGGSVVNNLPANAGDVNLIPDSGISPGEGNGNPLPIFLPGKIHGQRSIEGYSPQGCKVLDTT